MTRCPNCGYSDPFMPSWYDHEREVAELGYFAEWNVDLWLALLDNPWVEFGDFMYHLTSGRGTRGVQRYRIVDLIARKGQKIVYDSAASGRKNWHIKGKLAARKTVEALVV